MGSESVVRGLYEALNRHDAASAAGCYAADAVNHGRPVGRVGMQRVFEGLLSAFPDLRYELVAVVADGDEAVARTVMHGTHRGEPTMPELFHGALAGVPPTGRVVSVPQYHRYRVRGSEITEHDAVRDDLVMLVQLGLFPPDQPDGDGRMPTRS